MLAGDPAEAHCITGGQGAAEELGGDVHQKSPSPECQEDKRERGRLPEENNCDSHCENMGEELEPSLASESARVRGH